MSHHSHPYYVALQERVTALLPDLYEVTIARICTALAPFLLPEQQRPVELAHVQDIEISYSHHDHSIRLCYMDGHAASEPVELLEGINSIYDDLDPALFEDLETLDFDRQDEEETAFFTWTQQTVLAFFKTCWQQAGADACLIPVRFSMYEGAEDF
jgi:hypothetical protein